MFFYMVRSLIFSYLTNKIVKTIIIIKKLTVLSFFKDKLCFIASNTQ